MVTVRWALLSCLSLVLCGALAAPAAAAAWQPDLWIRFAGSPWVGDNVYSVDGTGQTASQSITPWGSITYYLRLQNDGETPDSYTLVGGGATPVWPVSYFDDWAGGVDITTAVFAGTWTSPVLAPGQYMNLRVVIGTTVYTPGGAVKQFMVRATSVGNPAARDVVRQVSTLTPRTRPDGQIRPAGDFAWLGNDLYNTTGLGQTAALTTSTFEVFAQAEGPVSATAVYYIRAQNDGNITDMLNIQGGAGGAGWTVAYYDALVGGTDITAAVTSGGGWVSPAVSALLYQAIRVEVTADWTVASGATLNTRVTCRSVGEPAAPPDVVVASTTNAGGGIES